MRTARLRRRRAAPRPGAKGLPLREPRRWWSQRGDRTGSGVERTGFAMLSRAEQWLSKLEGIITPYGSALVAFSGGVDSSLALAVAARALPRDKVLAVTSNNETYLPSELDLARGFVESLGVEHLVVNTRELDNPNYASNPTNRCYFCKSTLYSDLARLAEERIQ